MGGSRPDGQKTVLTTFSFFLFLVLNLFNSLQRGSNGFVKENTIFFQGSSGGPTFSIGGVQLFSRGGGGGPKLTTIETHIT